MKKLTYKDFNKYRNLEIVSVVSAACNSHWNAAALCIMFDHVE